MVEAEGQNIRVFCPTHSTDSPFLRRGEILCENGGESLSENFPYEGFWEYCCDCLFFSPMHLENLHEVDDKCHICGRKNAQRFLCNQCGVFTIASAERLADKPFILPLDKQGPIPSCPGCLTPLKSALGEHHCCSIWVSYVTARDKCPFCHEAVEIISEEKKSEAGSPATSSEVAVAVEQIEDSNKIENINSPPEAVLKGFFSPRTKRWLKSKERMLEWIALGGFLLTVFGTVIGIVGFTPIYSMISRSVGKAFSKAPILKAIVPNKREIPAGETVLLKAVTENSDNQNFKFHWTCSAGLIEGSGPDVRLNTLDIAAQAVPFKVTVTARIVDDYGRSDARELDVYVLPISLINNSPILKTIKCNCDTQEVRSGEKVSLTALAEDPDGDELIYEWQSSTGQIEGTGPNVTLNTSGIRPASNFAPVKVTLTVKDGRGRSISNDITINVVPEEGPQKIKEAPPPPANNPPLLVTFQADKSVVEAGEPVRLEALATDPDNDKLIYEWDSSKGQIESGGPSVLLNTTGLDPGKGSGRVVVTLTIRDGRGASASGKIIITLIPRKPKATEPEQPAAKATPLIFLLRPSR